MLSPKLVLSILILLLLLLLGVETSKVEHDKYNDIVNTLALYPIGSHYPSLYVQSPSSS